jgi:hypothetical protein
MGRKQGRVAQYADDRAILPTALHFSGEGETIPVTLVYATPVYKKGGLVDHALTVKRAGRNGDTELVHVNKDELEELRQMWGEPTINPETGLPEYFLKKVWKGVKKIAKPLASLAPIAASFIPGVGPLAAAAIGAGSGLLSGKGIKGALMGGVTGALGAGALGGAAKGAAAAGDAAGAATTAAGAASSAAPAIAKANETIGQMASATGNNLVGSLQSAAPQILGSALGQQPQAAQQQQAPSIEQLPTVAQRAQAASSALVPAAAPQIQRNDVSLPTVSPQAQQGKPNFWNQDFLGIKGLPNKFGIPIGLLAATALMGKKKGGGEDLEEGRWKNHLQPVFRSSLPSAGNSFYAEGGRVEGLGEPFPAPGPGHSGYHVEGVGTGRSDEIDAKLSDGEYVIDAETVALLGDGSTKAGAKKLDALRVNIRKHKGAKLAQGKISPDAKDAKAYLPKGA